MTRHGNYDSSRWVAEHIDKMTADPAQHLDTYAESCHRGFFANLHSGVEPMRCGAVSHDTPSMGALVDQRRGDAFVVGRTYSLACYITDSWPSVCHLAARYSMDPRKAQLTNTNPGGENAHLGAVLGTLVGLASGSVDSEL